MKKSVQIIAILMLFLTTVFVGVGCTPKNSSIGDEDLLDTSNPFEERSTPDNAAQVVGSYGFGIENPPQDGKFEYSGEFMRIPMSIRGDMDGTEAMIKAFLNGINQPFSIEINGTEISNNGNEYIFNLKADEKIMFDMVFTPITGKSGDEIALTFTGILAPSYIPKSEKNANYGVYHQALRMNTVLKMNHDAPDSSLSALDNVSITPFSSAILEANKNPNGTNQLDDSTRFVLFAGDADVNTEVITADEHNTPTPVQGKGNTKLTLRAYGGDTISYRTTIFINHKPVKIDGNDYITV